MYKNPLIAPSLTDEVIEENGVKVYCHDCHNLPICKSYGEISLTCLSELMPEIGVRWRIK